MKRQRLGENTGGITQVTGTEFILLILNLERTLFIRHQNGCLTKNCY